MTEAKSSAATASVLPELTMTRVFAAPRSLVFKMWTDPKHVSQWWGPHGFANPTCKLDLRPGGAIQIDMRGSDGAVYPMGGEFREIVEPERLVFTTTAVPGKDGNPQLETLVTVMFVEHEGGTKMTVHVRVTKVAPEASFALSGMEIGWTQSLERLADIVADPWNPAPLAAREIVIQRMIDAPRESVFDAWTDAEQIAKWWGPNGFRTTTFSMDVRPGGLWDFTMHGPDGRDYKNKIVYLEVVRPARLAYQHAGEGADAKVEFHSTVTFGQMFGKTVLTLRMVFQTAEEREYNVKTYHSVEGGEQTLGRLAKHVESRKSSN
jgi:uncharacterized protein YndB with AHSA1/START domain